MVKQTIYFKYIKNWNLLPKHNNMYSLAVYSFSSFQIVSNAAFLIIYYYVIQNTYILIFRIIDSPILLADINFRLLNSPTIS